MLIDLAWKAEDVHHVKRKEYSQVAFGFERKSFRLGGIYMELDYVEIGRRIAERRKKMNMKQNELANAIGISNNYLSGIERGKENPSLEILMVTCSELKTTPDYLTMGTMRPNNVPESIVQGLRLCSKEDIELIDSIVKLMIDRRSDAWSEENFV